MMHKEVAAEYDAERRRMSSRKMEVGECPM